MKKYRVCGVVEVAVYKEVWANNEDEAYEKASEQLCCLSEYCGNGGWDKLVGVDGEGESVEACSNEINYNDIELLEDNPSYHECPECGEELDEERDGVFYCWDCEKYFNSDGEEIWPDDEEEDEE